MSESNSSLPTSTGATTQNQAAPPQDQETAEMKLIVDEYKMWKKNSPYLYDHVMTHALEWPSLTVQWLPDKIAVPDQGYTIQRLITGTHTFDGEQNYLCISEVRLPNQEINERLEARPEKPDGASYGVVSGKVEIVQEIVHEGEVNRARYMPQNPNIIATKSPSKDVFIFDKSKYPSRSTKGAQFAPDIRLSGHKKEGYGLAWSPLTKGLLLSGSDDALVCMWDIQASPSKDTVMQPLATYSGHKAVVEDVAFSPFHSHMFGSVGDDKMLMIWDSRSKPKPVVSVQGHKAEVNALSFNFHNEHLLATGSGDMTCGLWDLRDMSKKIHSFESHQNQVFGVAWAPHSEFILASCSTDRRIALWDVTRIGEEQEPDDAEDGPPELLFFHAGHTDKVADMCWNPNEPWMMASVADDAVMQIWKPSQAIWDDQDEDDDNDNDDMDGYTDLETPSDKTVSSASSLKKEDLE